MVAKTPPTLAYGTKSIMEKRGRSACFFKDCAINNVANHNYSTMPCGARPSRSSKAIAAAGARSFAPLMK